MSRRFQVISAEPILLFICSSHFARLCDLKGFDYGCSTALRHAAAKTGKINFGK
jgi:hypothetical protein